MTDALATVQEKAEIERSEVQELLDAAKELVVSGDDDLEFVSRALREVKTRNKKLEELKQSVTKPLRETVDKIRAWFNPAQSALAETESVLKRKVAVYHAELERERRKALQAAEDAVDHGTTPQVEAALARVAEVQKPTTDGLSMRKVWDYEVVDLALVPRNLLELDTAKVRAAVQAGTREIPGIRIFQKDVVTSR